MPDYLSEPAVTLLPLINIIFKPLGLTDCNSRQLTIIQYYISYPLELTQLGTHQNVLLPVLTNSLLSYTLSYSYQTISSIYYIWLTILTSISFWHPLQTRVSNFTLRKSLTLFTTFQLVIITHTLTIIFLTIHLISAQRCTIYCLKLLPTYISSCILISSAMSVFYWSLDPYLLTTVTSYRTLLPDLTRPTITT